MQVIEDSESLVYSTDDLKQDLSDLIQKHSRGKIFLLCDTNTYKYCYPKIKDINGIDKQNTIIIKDGDQNKTLKALSEVWLFLSNNGADRKSLLINLGGGMPCDLGGFAASTFKRGIDFINIPTTLLSQVDASVGGKTGINFSGLKNEIGVFNHATAVLVDSTFTETQDHKNISSGFAEMIKHALIYSDNKIWDDIKTFPINNASTEVLKPLVIRSINIKESFVKNDPKEQNIRKSLNFGHTIGHAFESLCMKKDKAILHGYAVAYGMIAELYLCHKKCGFPLETIKEINTVIENIYGRLQNITMDDFTDLFHLMTHDKKNEKNQINFTLLKKIGNIKIDQTCTKEEIKEAIEFYLNPSFIQK